ncbi:MAG TPA: SPOR domain-containing protein [Steroidobacteraceae bacterium]|nr:SPOR domain-containing protein [Steroidobacteraceae bacterium]
MKERLTGAIILVALIVLLVPELLTGPIRTRSAPAASATRAAAPLRSYTLTLGAPLPADAAPATPAAQSAAQPAQASALQSSTQTAAESGAENATEGSEPRQAPSTRAVTAHAEAPRVSRQSPGPAPESHERATHAPESHGPDLHVAKVPAHPPVREARAAASAGGWVVQLGSFASRRNANRLAHSLAGKGFHMSVSPAHAGSRVLWRVRAGPAHDRAGAQRLAARLRALGHRGELLPAR